ncbi:MAG TPA: M1 family aminopeptidase [Longimicrobiales bacterium]|nr:M1 family aminopeptidase [Longimicrobiales bacterium]
MHLPIFVLAALFQAAPGGARPAGATPPGAASPAPGVPLALARDRAARVSDVRYEVSLRIPADPTERIPGEETVRFALSDASRPLALDFQPGAAGVLGIDVGGRPAAYDVANGHIVLPPRWLKRGENALHIRFLAGDASLNRNPDYVYTLFVPARASAALPVFDQPDLKARFTLTLEVPTGWQVVANGPERDRAEGDSTTTVRFAETKPIPTYLFSFVAGKWSVETAERGGRTLRMFHREKDTAKVARNRDAIFDLVARSIDYMERYTGIPFPFDKYDFVLVPSFQFGGMEHPGAILFNASALMLDESATQNQKLGRASVIAHETAHMWFGDLVTMRWFDDVWMKEVFANFMAAKIVNPSFPDIDHELRFLLAHYPAAYEVDRTAGTHPIRQELANLDEAGQLYGAIIYQKAPIVMRQLERLVGEDAFREGVGEYLAAHRYGNATWGELIDALGRHTSENLGAWSRVWVEEAGLPTVRVTLTRDARGRIASLALTQADPAGLGRLWVQPASVVLVYGERTAVFPVRLDRALVDVAAVRGLAAPDLVLPNGDGRVYGHMVLSPADRGTLLRILPDLPQPILRGAAWLDLRDALLDGYVPPAAFADLALRALDRETDEQLTQLVLADLSDVFWRFLAPEERTALAPRLEDTLWRLLGRASTTSARAAFFAALRSTATRPESLARLTRVWAGDTAIVGLPLAEQDFTSLALQLAVRGGPDADSILAAQERRIQDPDRRARLAFVRPALSADAAVRDAWFDALRRPESRQHEPWVLEGLAYLNHPLRAEHAERYIRPALDMLEEIRRTGDIFFPKRWMDATLSGHASPAAAETVRRFLAERPDYPPRLRQIVLQSADELFRAARIGAARAPDVSMP